MRPIEPYTAALDPGPSVDGGCARSTWRYSKTEANIAKVFVQLVSAAVSL